MQSVYLTKDLQLGTENFHVVRIMVPKCTHVLTPRTCDCHNKWQEGLCRSGEDFGMRLLWVIQTDPV